MHLTKAFIGAFQKVEMLKNSSNNIYYVIVYGFG